MSTSLAAARNSGQTYKILVFGGNEKQQKNVFAQLESAVHAKTGRPITITTIAPCWRKNDGRSAERAIRAACSCDAVLLLTYMPTATAKVIRRRLRRLGVPFRSTRNLGLGGLTRDVESLIDSLDERAAHV